MKVDEAMGDGAARGGPRFFRAAWEGEFERPETQRSAFPFAFASRLRLAFKYNGCVHNPALSTRTPLGSPHQTSLCTYGMSEGEGGATTGQRSRETLVEVVPSRAGRYDLHPYDTSYLEC